MEQQKSSLTTELVSKVAGVSKLNNYEELYDGSTRIVDLHSSMYLIPINETRREFILIDSGINTYAKKLRSYLGQTGLCLNAIKEVYTTHAHADHVGGLSEIYDQTDAEIFISKEELPVLSGQKISQGPVPYVIDVLTCRRLASVPEVKPTLISEGDFSNKIGKLSIKAISVPGHTDGSLSYLVSSDGGRTGALYVGDALDFDKSGSVKPAALMFSKNHQESKNSINHLVYYIEENLGTKIRQVIPSHSGQGRFGSVRNYAFNS